MTKALQKIFEEASKLSEAKQDALAAILRQELDGDARWEELFNDPRSEKLLDQLAAEALEDDRKGLTTPLTPDQL